MSLNAKENGNLKKLANFGMDALETIITKLFKNADEQSFPMPSNSAEGLDLLKNVNINSPVDGQVLTYDSDNDEWTNATGGSTYTALGTDESGRTTASQSYASGDYFYKDGYMCKALTSISAGATLTLNTNYSQGTLADILKAIENA